MRPALLILDGTVSSPSAVEKLLVEFDARARPYVLMLSNSVEEQAVIRAFDCGVDAYAQFSASPAEILSRIPVAERALTVRRHVCAELISMEALCRRHDLLGRVILNRSATQDRVTEHDPKPAHAPPQDQSASPMATVLVAATSDVIASALTGLGLAGARVTSTSHHGNWEVCAVSAIVVDAPCLCISVRIDANIDHLQSIYREMVGANEETLDDLFDSLGEFLNILQGSIKNRLCNTTTVVASRIPRVRLRASDASAQSNTTPLASFALSIAGVEIQMCVIPTVGDVRTLPPNKLRPEDILLRDIGVPGTGGVLLPRGTLLTQQQVHKLHELDMQGRPTEAVIVRPLVEDQENPGSGATSRVGPEI
ncbi:MAG: hypothetical protein HZA52_17415 [Planctomycetes bacterium]|nr:hypothetical protein [Planctomycetota bacterium]